MEELFKAVSALLEEEHDFTLEEADKAIEDDYASSPDRWDGRFAAKTLADFLAVDDD